MDILKQLQAEAEQVEVVSLRNEATTIEFEANRFKTSKVEETSGVAARVVRNGRLGFSACSDEKALDRLVVMCSNRRLRGRGADQIPRRRRPHRRSRLRPGHPGADRGAPGGDRTGSRRPGSVGRARSAGQR